MPRITDNYTQNRSLNNLNSLSSQGERNSARLATGKNINTAGEDPAGLAVSLKLESKFREFRRRSQNLQDEVSLIQTADGALGQGLNLLQDIRTKVVQAGNGIYTDSDRQIINNEIQSALQHIDTIGNNTEFNTKTLFDGNFSLGQDGGGKLPQVSMESLELNNIDVSTEEGRNQALSRIDAAIEQVSSNRADLGARENGLKKAIQNYDNTEIQLISSYSKIADADIAREIVEKTRIDLLTQSTLKVIRMDMQKRNQLLNLLK
ncbi:flagellin [Candidatus Riflebacteria bacterium]